MSLLALAAATLLSQAEPAAEPPVAAPAPAPAQPAATPPPSSEPVAPVRRQPSLDEMTRQLERIRKLPPTEVGEAMEDFRRKFPGTSTFGKPAPTAPPTADVPPEQSPLLKNAALSDADQVKFFARDVFNNVISGDARGLVLQAGYPFQLEDRRLEMPDELHKEWLKNLRSKRTDLLTLYDVEVFTPAEMEKKYGRPPARLHGLPWQAPHTLIAVGNLSGHAAVAVFRGSGPGGWLLIGYHD